MIRDLSRFSARTFDVLVVGGGVYGLTIACDAAQRGLSVALIERQDFGSGSSFNHLRTIHGGLRYLQSLDVRRARESIRERRTLARIAPHAVRPLPFVLPLYRSVMKGRAAMRAGLLLDRLLARDRNEGVATALELPAGQVLTRGEAIDRFPALPRRDLAGAALWWDYVTLEADRLTFSWAAAAVAYGAVIANYVEADALLLDGQRVLGVRAQDRRTGATLEINARTTVNATSFAVDRLLRPLRASTSIAFLKAMNLVTKRRAGDEALGGRGPEGRHLFLVPWRSRALFGTWESRQVLDPPDTTVTESEVATFVDDLNQAFPALDLRRDDVTLVHRGLVPAAVSSNGGTNLEAHEQIRDHKAQGVDGILSVAGTKYTTARAVAERVTDGIVSRLGQSAAPCRTAATALPGGDLPDPRAAVAAVGREYGAMLDADVIDHLVAAYGAGHREILALTAIQPELARRVSDESPVIGAELLWAVRHEMVVTLNDAVLRRTPLGALGYPGDAAASYAAAIVGHELGWSEEQKRSEIAALKDFYRID